MADTDAKRLRDFRVGTIANDIFPACFPGGWLKIGTHDLQGTPDEVLPVFLLPDPGGVVGGLKFAEDRTVRLDRRLGPALLIAPLVEHDRAQPIPEAFVLVVR